jgi:RNA polymerase sigma-70 factor (ECF subfamily)
MQSEIKTHVENCKNGDVNSFKFIFELYHPTVYGVCKKMTGDTFYAEDITSQVFVTLWKKREIINPDYPILQLIIKITKDLVANHFNKVIREKSNLDKYLKERTDSEFAADESDLMFRIYLDIAQQAISQLPDKRKEVFQLYFYQNLSYADISHQIGIEESTVRVHVFKALEYLRNYIQSHPDFAI